MPTVQDLRARSFRQSQPNVQLDFRGPQALELIADVLIAILEELQAQKKQKP
jgi:hypothetical protein